MKKVDHIGIAVSSLEESLPLYTEVFGMKHVKTELVETQGVAVAFLDGGNVKLELLEPASPDSPIAKFIERRGQGIHHIALKVKNIEERIVEMKEKGIQMIDNAPKPGAGGASIAFMHPKSTGGVLMELCEKREELS
ncbi:methylmalonyl-CoA epimerase [Domibacillus indicus]|uniref:methylmalonyl-CoA epimerase n=1 Tax=Domibacillus indicus TaxID=1437523 RepID=UPI000617B3A2|nr:methylmalonyl-CoA epimerase [Domibacillus indicus]